MAKGTNQHIVSHDGGWAVRSEGSQKVTRQFETQREAIAHGRQIAMNQQSELIIHNQEGQIRERNSYGNDPFPPQVKDPKFRGRVFQSILSLFKTYSNIVL